MENQALVIIDVQNNYFKGGYCQLYNSEGTTIKIKKVIDYFRESKKPIYYIKHDFTISGITEEENEKLRSINDIIKPKKDDVIIEKKYPSSFLKTTLKKELDARDIKELVIVGMMSHMCVDTTVRAAMDYGYKVVVLEDGCTTKSLETKSGEVSAEVVHNVFMASLQGYFAEIKTVDKYLRECKA